MEVILADNLGFCYGVKRAIAIARENASADGTACTLGPIIHNPQMVARLKEQGVGAVDSLDEIAQGTIIIRSHGVGPQVYETAEQRDLELVDATCPHVKKAQLSANSLVDDGYHVVIIGEKNHPEVRSIFEWTKGQAEVIETVAEAEQLKPCSKLGIVCQTTFSEVKFRQITVALLEKSRDIKILRTICTATELRQTAAVDLAKLVDVMIVIGGKNSANTTRLAQICQEHCKTYHVETVAELQDEWFDNIEKIGITAGASTPDWIIKEVYKKVSEQSMKELLEAEENAMPEIHEHTVVKGTVIQVSRDGAYVDIGYKQEIHVPNKDLAYPAPESADEVVKVGDEIEVFVNSLGGDNGGSLSKVKADRMVAWKEMEKLQEAGQTVQATVTQVVKGGLVASVNGLRGFIPASQMELHFVKDLQVYVDQTVECEIIEIDAFKQRLVLSRRNLLAAARKEKEAEIFANLEAGQTVHGTVKRIVDYGAFIDIGGVDGLAHISDLAWHRVKHPSDVLEVGQELEVFVKSVDQEARRISLSVKDTQEDPWVASAANYKENDIIEGKIIKLTDFGAFMEIEPGFDGLIPMGELAEKRIERADEAVHVGDVVKVKVLRIDTGRKRISLSITKARD